MLIAETVDVFAVHCRGEGMVAIGDGFLMELISSLRVRNLSRDFVSGDPMVVFSPLKARTYPEVNIQVTTASKLAICDLEGHGHFVIGV